MNIAIVGTGYVGLVTGACFSNSGNSVVCLDVDESKIDQLRRGGIPFYEPGLNDVVERNVAAGRLRFTTDSDEAFANAETIFICVGTPADANGDPDLRFVDHVAESIGDRMSREPADRCRRTIVVKSTVPVGTTQRVREIIAARATSPFSVANNPEFLKEGAAIADFLRPDRVVCGVEDEAAADTLRVLYQPFVRQGNPIQMVDIRSSEMIKYASNAMLACKISFVNELAGLCDLYGADIAAVREGMCADRRIGREFLYPGLGYGGSCFPKDTLAVISMGQARGFECQLNRAVHAVNQQQRRSFWEKIVSHFGGELAGRRLAFWGVAFKPETDDIRDAPSVDLMRWAAEAGATVCAYDPVAAANLADTLPDVTTVDDMYEVLDGADCLVICTEWSEFRHPAFGQMADRLRETVIFDGRNVYSRRQLEQLGFTYYSVGRPPVVQERHGREAA